MWECERCGYSAKQKCHLVRHLNNVNDCQPTKSIVSRRDILSKIEGKRVNTGLSREECEVQLKTLFDEHGAIALVCTWLCKNGHQKLYDTYSHIIDCSLEKLAIKWETHEEWKSAKKQHHKKRPDLKQKNIDRAIWTLDKIDKTMTFIIEKYGFLPPSNFIDDELGCLNKFHKALYHNGGLAHYKIKYGIVDRLRTYDVLKRRWRSFPEAALSNFLISKQIIPDSGEKYPDIYKDFSGNSAWYDMHFVAPVTNLRINIEIWGGPGRNSSGSEIYEKQKQNKIVFHQNDETFINFHHQKCFDLTFLEETFLPHIGIRPIYNDVRKVIIDPTKWSLSNELVEKGREICTHFENGLLPKTGWFLKTGLYKDRKVDEWEQSTWSGFMDDVGKIGGIKILQNLLGQSNYAGHIHRITREETLLGIKKIYEEHSKTIGALSHIIDKNDDLNNLLNRLQSGINLHFDNNTVNAYQEIGIDITPRQRTGGREGIIKSLQQFYQKHARKPSGIAKTLTKKLDRTPEEDALKREAATLVSNCQRYFPKYSDALTAAGI